MLLSVGRTGGMLLNLLVREARSQRILELGTSYGYSAVWLAEAARATGGRIISLDVAAYKQAEAAKSLAEAGLDGLVEFQAGDALEIIPRLEGTFDFVFMDIWKDLYGRAWTWSIRSWRQAPCWWPTTCCARSTPAPTPWSTAAASAPCPG
ncbi:MAG: class I SAM-dependent methyltransferase [Caulobacteraceae bacterium]